MDLEFKEFWEYTDVFFWTFKTMDNANYNFYAAQALAAVSKGSLGSHKPYYYKAIYINIVGIIECILYDFLCRISQHRNEKIKNLDQDYIKKIMNTKVPNRLLSYNDIFMKYKLLGKEEIVYQGIKKVSAIRNRVHIQNIKRALPYDECDVWTKDNIDKCEQLLQCIISLMYNLHKKPLNSSSIPEMKLFPKIGV